MTDNEYNELIKEIEFEKKWLIDLKRTTIHDIDIAFDSITHKLTILKKKECEYYDSEAETCRRSEAEFDELNNLYYGMTDSMQKAVKDIMLSANGKEIEE